MYAMRCTGDKAYHNDDDMKGASHPQIAIHGSFSLMVNYGVLRHYIDTKAGFSMMTPYSDGFKVACFVTGVPQVRTRNMSPNYASTHTDMCLCLSAIIMDSLNC